MGRPKEVSNKEIVAVARRCFLEKGIGVSAVEIAGELGVSHTTLFNRFGSKEGLMIAALGTPEEIPWLAALEAGPDDRPLQDQLLEQAKAMATYFTDLQAGLGLLSAAGIDPNRANEGHEGTPPPVLAFQALTGWLDRAQDQGRLAKCDVNTLASTILGALHARAFTAQVCSVQASSNGEDYAERFIKLLWDGIGVGKT